MIISPKLTDSVKYAGRALSFLCQIPYILYEKFFK